MRILFTFCILAVLFLSACEEPDPEFPEDIILTCQEDVDMIAPLLVQGVFDVLDPEAAFRGSLTIDSGGSCGSPITDLSFFSEFKFWLGALTITSDDLSNLDFLANIEQFRNGLSIVGCANLSTINLPSCAEIEGNFDVIDNPLLTTIQIGNNHPEETYEEINIDSLELRSNPILEAWTPGRTRVDFGTSARILDNPLLTNLTALSSLSMPRNLMDMQLYGAIINETGENLDPDSLNMPAETFIEAVMPANDYSWLSKAKSSPRFNDEGINIGRITTFRIMGSVTVPELCPLATIADTTGLEVFSTSNTGTTMITPEILLDECPE